MRLNNARRVCALLNLILAGNAVGAVLIGRVVDDASNKPIPARVYVAAPDGKPLLCTADDGKRLVFYDKTDRAVGTRETYTCIGAELFRVELPEGKSVITIERGKEYVPLRREIHIAPGTPGRTEETFRLIRLFNLASMGWYSGDLHVHTPIENVPAAQLADDLNVTFPMAAWAGDSKQKPTNRRGMPPIPAEGKVIPVDDTHVYWNLNSEYEIFTMQGKEGYGPGAILILGHKKPFELTAPPIQRVAEEAHRQGAILDWDKHSWSWSTMLVPVASIDTIELSNNHMWRGKPRWSVFAEPPAAWMNWTNDAAGWAEYGFHAYYALLNSGFNLRPSAGTANGVHPVPLGHSRVYVKIDGPFSYEKWVEGLQKGRSFVTNGPALLLTVDGMLPGDRKTISAGQTIQANVAIEARTAGAIDHVDVIVNGKIAHRFDVALEGGTAPSHQRFSVPINITGTSWLAVRCFEVATKDNVRFAHTGPIFFDDPTRPLVPEKQQIDFLIDSVRNQIKRNTGKIPDDALAEYERALRAYQAVDERRQRLAALGSPGSGAAEPASSRPAR